MSRNLWARRAGEAGLAALGGALFWGLATLNAVLVVLSSAALAARGVSKSRVA